MVPFDENTIEIEQYLSNIPKIRLQESNNSLEITENINDNNNIINQQKQPKSIIKIIDDSLTTIEY